MDVRKQLNMWQWISLLGMCMMIGSVTSALKLRAAAMFTVGCVLVVCSLLAAIKLAIRNRNQKE